MHPRSYYDHIAFALATSHPFGNRFLIAFTRYRVPFAIILSAFLKASPFAFVRCSYPELKKHGGGTMRIIQPGRGVWSHALVDRISGFEPAAPARKRRNCSESRGLFRVIWTTSGQRSPRMTIGGEHVKRTLRTVVLDASINEGFRAPPRRAPNRHKGRRPKPFTEAEASMCAFGSRHCSPGDPTQPNQLLLTFRGVVCTERRIEIPYAAAILRKQLCHGYAPG
jgi:hypothetical protein